MLLLRILFHVDDNDNDGVTSDGDEDATASAPGSTNADDDDAHNIVIISSLLLLLFVLYFFTGFQLQRGWLPFQKIYEFSRFIVEEVLQIEKVSLFSK